MKYTTRELVLLAVFGALWGMVEISLGSVFHAIKLPFTGLSLATIGLFIALIGRLFVPRKGSIFFIGMVAMILKLFSIGSVLIGPMIGILTEAAIAEIIVSVFRAPRLLAFVLAQAGGALWTLVQPFVTGILIFGRDLLSIWLDTIDLGSRLLGIPSQFVYWIVLALVVLHAGVGAFGGWLAWKIGHLVLSRSNRRFSEVN